MSLRTRTVLLTILLTLFLYGCGGKSGTYKGFTERRDGVVVDTTYLANGRSEAYLQNLIASFDSKWNGYYQVSYQTSELNNFPYVRNTISNKYRLSATKKYQGDVYLQKLKTKVTEISNDIISNEMNKKLASLDTGNGVGAYQKDIDKAFVFFKSKVMSQIFKRLGDVKGNYRYRLETLENSISANIQKNGDLVFDDAFVQEAYNIQMGLNELDKLINFYPISSLPLPNQGSVKVQGLSGYLSSIGQGLSGFNISEKQRRMARSYLEQARFQLEGAQGLIDKWNASYGMNMGRLALATTQPISQNISVLTNIIKQQIVLNEFVKVAASSNRSESIINGSLNAINQLEQLEYDLAEFFKQRTREEYAKIKPKFDRLTRQWKSLRAEGDKLGLTDVNYKSNLLGTIRKDHDYMGMIELKGGGLVDYSSRVDAGHKSLSLGHDATAKSYKYSRAKLANIKAINETRKDTQNLTDDVRLYERMALVYEMRVKLGSGDVSLDEGGFKQLNTAYNNWRRDQKNHDDARLMGRVVNSVKLEASANKILSFIEGPDAVKNWGGHFTSLAQFNGMMYFQDILGQDAAIKTVRGTYLPAYPSFESDQYITFFEDRRSPTRSRWMKTRDNVVLHSYLAAYKLLKSRNTLKDALKVAKSQLGSSDAKIWSADSGLNKVLGIPGIDPDSALSEGKLSLKNKLDSWLADSLAISQKGRVVDTAISLQKAMSFALENNLKLKLAEYKIRLASRDGVSSKLKLLPSLEVNASRTVRSSYDQTDLLNVNTGEVIASPLVSSRRGSTTADIALTWDVLGTVIDYVAFNQSNRKIDKLRMEKKALELDIAKRLMDAYFTASLNQYLLQFFNGQWIKLYTSLNSNSSQAPQLIYNEIRLQKRLVKLSEDIKIMEKEYLVARNKLIKLVGLDQSANFELRQYDENTITHILQALPNPSELNIYTLESLTLFNNPELYAQDIEINVVHDNARKAMLKMFPGLKLFAGDYYDGSDLRVNNIWNSIGASLSFNLANFFVHNAERKAFAKQEFYEKAKRILLTSSSIAKTHLALIRYKNNMDRLLLSDQSLVWACREKVLVEENFGKVLLGPQRLPFDVKSEWLATKAKKVKAITDVFSGYFDLLSSVGIPPRFWVKDTMNDTTADKFARYGVNIYPLQNKQSGGSFVINMYDRRMTGNLIDAEKGDDPSDRTWTSKRLEDQTGLDFSKEDRRMNEAKTSRFDRGANRNSGCMIDGRDCNPSDFSDGKMVQLLQLTQSPQFQKPIYDECAPMFDRKRGLAPADSSEGIMPMPSAIADNTSSDLGNDYLWKVQVGAFAKPDGPARRLKQVAGIGVRLLDPRDAKISYITLNEEVLTRVRFLGMPKPEAEAMCADFISKNMECWAVPPGW